MTPGTGGTSVLVEQLQQELSRAGDSEREVAYRGNLRYCRRLKPSAQHVLGPAVALRLDKRGNLENMQVVPEVGGGLASQVATVDDRGAADSLEVS